MQNHLPVNAVNLHTFFKAPRTYSDQIPISNFQRLKDLALNLDDRVSIHLDFYKNERNQKVMHGSIQSNLQLICQRCMKPMDFKLDTVVHFMLFTEEESSQAAHIDEEIIITNETCNIIELIEDEILVSIPLAPKHENKICNKGLEKYSKENFESIMSPSKSQFAKLATLKNKI